MNQNKILFVFEGEKKEKEFFDSFSQLLFPSRNVVAIGCYGNNIYELYKNLKNDEFSKFIDIVSLLKDYGCSSLEKYEKEDFGEIYLFFDYDPHDSKATESTIVEMLEIFNNETEQGMLFINYPMVESMYATKHCLNIDTFVQHSVLKEDCPTFKRIIGPQVKLVCDGKLQKYPSSLWAKLFILHCQKANFIINNKKEFPSIDICQVDLHNNVANREGVPVLSSFPLMYYYYHGHVSFKNLQEVMRMGYKINLGCKECNFSITLCPQDFQEGKEISCECGGFKETLGVVDGVVSNGKSQKVMPIIINMLLSNYPDEFYPAPLAHAVKARGVIVIRIDVKAKKVIVDDKLQAYIHRGYTPAENEELGLIAYSKAPDIDSNYSQVVRYIENIFEKRQDLFA